MAARAGLPAVALDTGIENRRRGRSTSASGFTGRGLRPAPSERVARAVGGSGFVGDVRGRPGNVTRRSVGHRGGSLGSRTR